MEALEAELASCYRSFNARCCTMASICVGCIRVDHKTADLAVQPCMTSLADGYRNS